MNTWNTVVAQGVGMVYMSGLDAAMRDCAELIDFVEVEPQQHWLQRPSDSGDGDLWLDSKQLSSIARFEKPIVFHSVGCPVGGSLSYLDLHAQALQESIEMLMPMWVSEHLSFNQFGDQTENYNAGFLLPPLATDASALCAARNIASFTALTRLPFAFETGVNYLQPRAEEMSDAQFTTRVAQLANCGILLDLHNIWCNALNGRQPVQEFLDNIPLERVVELHLAGGESLDGFWLDAHSGIVPKELMLIARDLIPRLPQLRAITFEIMDETVIAGSFDAEKLRKQLIDLHTLWSLRKANECPVIEQTRASYSAQSPIAGLNQVRSWEVQLATAVNHSGLDKITPQNFLSDSGVGLLKKLVEAVRAGTLIDTLRMSTTLLTLARGRDGLAQLLQAYWSTHAPLSFATSEAIRFADWLQCQNLGIPGLNSMINLERGACVALATGVPVRVEFDRDPAETIDAILHKQIPPDAIEGQKFALDLSSS